ncbi:MAG: hypothetical protein KAJ75_00030 [Alphaproteobacteria bacterium]|nr:hypothetical protein [Alphaproteobacteria bacterium]
MQISLTADILENESGELLLTFHTPDGEPKEPTLDVLSSSVILHRHKEQDIIIENVHVDAREKLAKAKQIMISEVDSDGVKNAYYVPINSKVA